MRPTDEDLVEAFQGGDTAAFDLLVQRWDRKIQGAIYRFVGASEDAVREQGHCARCARRVDEGKPFRLGGQHRNEGVAGPDLSEKDVGEPELLLPTLLLL